MNLKVTQIRGKKDIIRKLEKIDKFVPNSMQHALQYGADLLRDRAIQNLVNLSKEPGMSLDGESIANKENWGWQPESQLTGRLSCNSKHAAVVELGGEQTGTTLVVKRGSGGFPIGKQQYGQASFDDQGKPMIRRAFLIQRPKYYFRSAIESQWVKESIKNRIKRDVWKSMRSVL